jgi:hypothetical protein
MDIITSTRKHCEKQQSRTAEEKEAEIMEEEFGLLPDVPEEVAGKDDDDDAPIYNPLNIPLGWDGKPIPYWLYKKNVEGLSIRRSLVKKRLSISRSQVYGDYLKQINDPNVEKYFFTVDKDDSSRQRFKSYQRHYKP